MKTRENRTGPTTNPLKRLSPTIIALKYQQWLYPFWHHQRKLLDLSDGKLPPEAQPFSMNHFSFPRTHSHWTCTGWPQNNSTTAAFHPHEVVFHSMQTACLPQIVHSFCYPAHQHQRTLFPDWFFSLIFKLEQFSSHSPILNFSRRFSGNSRPNQHSPTIYHRIEPSPATPPQIKTPNST